MHSTVEKAWRRLPRPIQDFIASTLDRAQGVKVLPPPIIADRAPIRVFVGPVNYAGQGFRWLRAAEQNPLVKSRTMVGAENNPFGYEVDYAVRWRTMTHSRAWQRKMLDSLTTHYTHVIFEAQMPLLGGMFKQDIRRQIAALRRGGVKVGMVCHGSDIRLPSRHRESEPWSYFANDDWVPVDRFEEEVQANIDLLADVEAPTFVSTPGLLMDVPDGHLLPVVIDPAKWVNAAPVLERARPRVLHVPTNPLPKGTMHIAPALARLHDEGVIEYIQLSGMSHSEMPSLYAAADIMLDQFRVGDYGVASCEAMAAGRVVVGHVSDQAREAVKSVSGLDLPIVEATIDTIEEVIREIVANRDKYRAVAVAGPDFVRTTHDGRLARAVLEQHFFEI